MEDEDRIPDGNRHAILVMNEWLRELKQGLQEAWRLYDDGKDAGRVGAIRSLRAVHEFLARLEHFEPELRIPLSMLMGALQELDNGVHPILKPPPPPDGGRKRGPRRDDLDRRLLKAEASAAVDRLMSAGMEQSDAERDVAKILKQNGAETRGGTSKSGIRSREIIPLTIHKWREDIRDGVRDEFETSWYRTRRDADWPANLTPSRSGGKHGLGWPMFAGC